MEGMGREMLTTFAFAREEEEGGEGEGGAMEVEERGGGSTAGSSMPPGDGAPSKKRKLNRSNGTNGISSSKDLVLNPDAAHAMHDIKLRYGQLRDMRLDNIKSQVDLNEYYRGMLAHAQRLIMGSTTVGEVIRKRVVEFRDKCHELRRANRNVETATLAVRWDNCEWGREERGGRREGGREGW